MIPDHLIDKAIRAQIIAEGRDPDDRCEGWKFDSYDHGVRAALEAVAADIWDEGYEAGEEDGYLMGRDEPFTETAPNPYRASETA